MKRGLQINYLIYLIKTVEYIKKVYCKNCKFKEIPKTEYNKCLICTMDDFLYLDNLESILLFIIPENKKESCNICKYKINSLEISYE